MNSFQLNAGQMVFGAKVANRLRQLRRLPKGWDGHSGRPTEDRACALAKRLLSDQIIRGPLPDPGIVPLSDGGLQIEWHRKGYDVEIEINGAAEDLFFLVREVVTGAETFGEIRKGDDFRGERLQLGRIDSIVDLIRD